MALVPIGDFMHGFETSKIVVPQAGRCQDQVAVKEFDSGIVIIIADGAGGSGHGDLASRAVIAEVESSASLDLDTEDWCQLLRQVDQRIPAGESTCVVFSVSTKGVVGASVGDSQLWHLQDADLRNISEGQIRKPLLGSGDARPVGFAYAETTGLLLASTDGFNNYVRKDRLLREYLWHEFDILPRKLVDMVRLPSGQLWDDIGIVACRRRPAVQRKQRYSLDDEQ